MYQIASLVIFYFILFDFIDQRRMREWNSFVPIIIHTHTHTVISSMWWPWKTTATNGLEIIMKKKEIINPSIFPYLSLSFCINQLYPDLIKKKIIITDHDHIFFLLLSEQYSEKKNNRLNFTIFSFVYAEYI